MKIFDAYLLRLLGILACVWLWYHLKPQAIIQLVTPTQTIQKTVSGLPDWDEMRCIKP